LFILVDTNVWRSQPLLRTLLGDSLIYNVRRTGSKIALPEIIELEITKQLLRAVTEAREKAKAGLGTLAQVMGQVPEVNFPSDDEAREAIKHRLDDLADLIERVPFTHEHSRGALLRLIDETPPNGPKNQQFKDSAVWEAARELAGRGQVLFVTDDKGFFEGRDPTQGAARFLQDEIDRGVDIKLFYGLAACLEAIQIAPPAIDRDAVVKELHERLKIQLSDSLTKDGWVAADPSATVLDVFATEDPSRVTLSLHADYPQRTSPIAEVQATATYNVETNEVVEIALDTLTVKWTETGSIGPPVATRPIIVSNAAQQSAIYHRMSHDRATTPIVQRNMEEARRRPVPPEP
jgi:hypothetical protein